MSSSGWPSPTSPYQRVISRILTIHVVNDGRTEVHLKSTNGDLIYEATEFLENQLDGVSREYDEFVRIETEWQSISSADLIVALTRLEKNLNVQLYRPWNGEDIIQ